MKNTLLDKFCPSHTYPPHTPLLLYQILCAKCWIYLLSNFHHVFSLHQFELMKGCPPPSTLSFSCAVILMAMKQKHLDSLWISPLKATWLPYQVNLFLFTKPLCHRLMVTVTFSAAFFFFLAPMLNECLPFARQWVKLLDILSYLIFPTNLLGRYYSYSKDPPTDAWRGKSPAQSGKISKVNAILSTFGKTLENSWYHWNL